MHPNVMAARTRASKKDQRTSLLFVLSLISLCILSRTSMYSCSCFTAVIATESSLIISSSLFWWASVSMSFWGLPNINGEHHYLWSHVGHSVAKTKLICCCSIHVSSKCVFPTGLPVSFINSFIIRPCNLHVAVQAASLSHLKDEAYLAARGDPLEEALLGMWVDADTSMLTK